MHQVLVALLAAATLAIAGCSGGDGHAKAAEVTCPDGTVLTAEQVEADARHHEAAFNATELCPIPPEVRIFGVPASVQVYLKAPFTWEVDPGSVQHGHSMLMSVRYSTTSVPDAEASIETYSKEILKKEHQDLPKTFKGNMTFTTPGTVYVRAYAQVQGEGFPRIDVWSDEVVLNVSAVQPTGTVHTATLGLGPVGTLAPASLAAALGDELRFQNDDLVEHTLEMTTAPPGSEPCDLTAGGRAASEATCLFSVPGSYTFAIQGATPAKSMTVNVAQP